MPPRRSDPPPMLVVPETPLPDPTSAPLAELDEAPEIGDIQQLADPSYQDWSWWVYRIRNAAEMAADPKRRQRVIVTKVTGPLDVMEIKNQFGGGVYEFWGYYNGRMQMHPRYELEGPPKTYHATATPATVPAPSSNGDKVSEQLLLLLQRQQEQLNRLEARLNAAPAPAQGLTVVDILKLAPLIRGEQSSTGGDVMKEIVGAFKSGIELRGSVEGGAEKSTTEILVEKLAPSLERIATAFVNRRPGPRSAAPPRRSVPPSEATVIEGSPEAEPAAAEPNYRIMAAVDALARAIGDEADPAAFAVSLEDILNPLEFSWVRSKNTDELMAELADTTARYPVFRTEPARMFLDAMLAELRNPTGDDEAGPGSAS